MNYTYPNKMTSNPIIHLYNEFHMGDNIFSCIMFYNIKDYLIANNIIIHYYINTNWLNQYNQVCEFIPCDNVKIFSLTEKPENALNIWIANNELGCDYHALCSWPAYEDKMPHDDYLKLYFSKVLEKINIPIKINKLEYTDPDLLSRYNKLPESCKDIDILVINSEPCSTQYILDKNLWSNYINNLDDHFFNIITTLKVDGIKCTLDHQLSLKDIAALSTRCKVIIGVNTGVVPGIFNSYTLANVKKIFLLCDSCNYNQGHLNIQSSRNLLDIGISELKKYIHQ